MDRTCGTCDVCCKVLMVNTPEFSKEWLTPCEHLRKGGGCGIYDTRFTICRAYKCAWLLGKGEEHHRPDKCGVLIDPFTLVANSIRAKPIREGSADLDKAVEAMVAISRQTNLPVVVFDYHTPVPLKILGRGCE